MIIALLRLCVFFYLGAILGSLGSVLLLRLDAGINRTTITSILFGRSKDTATGQYLSRKELIPVYSRLKQKGKSQKTGAPLSPLYIILEVVCGVVIAATYHTMSSTGLVSLTEGIGISMLIFWVITNWLLTLLLIRDSHTMYLHMPIWTLLAVWILAWQYFSPLVPFNEAILSAIILVGLFIVIYLFASAYAHYRYNQAEGFGEGDIRLAALLGLLFPFVFHYNGIGLTAFSLSYIITLFMTMSAVLGLLRYTVHKQYRQYKQHKPASHTPQETIPFFPAMIMGYRCLMLGIQYIR